MKYFIFTILLVLSGFADAKPKKGLPDLAIPSEAEGEDSERLIAAEQLKNANEPKLEDVDEYLEWMAALDAAGKGVEATTKIKAFLAKYPNDKRAVFQLSVNAMRTKKRDLALFLLKRLEKDPDFSYKSYVYNNLGMMALHDHNRREAIEYFKKAVNAKPENPAPRVNLGALYLQSRSFKDALPLFEDAVDMDADLEDAHLGLGASLEGKGKFEEANKVYADYSSGHPQALGVVYNNAIILGNRLHRKAEAAEVMLRYIQRGGKETAKAQQTLQGWR